MNLSQKYDFLIAQEGFFDAFRSWQNKSEVEYWFVDVNGNTDITQVSLLDSNYGGFKIACIGFLTAYEDDSSIVAWYPEGTIVPSQWSNKKIAIKKYILHPRDDFASVEPVKNRKTKLKVTWKNINIQPVQVIESTISELCKKLGIKMFQYDETEFKSVASIIPKLQAGIADTIKKSKYKTLATLFYPVEFDQYQLKQFVSGMDSSYPLVGFKLVDLTTSDAGYRAIKEEFGVDLLNDDSSFDNWLWPAFQEMGELLKSVKLPNGLSISVAGTLSVHYDDPGFVLQKHR